MKAETYCVEESYYIKPGKDYSEVPFIQQAANVKSSSSSS